MNALRMLPPPATAHPGVYLASDSSESPVLIMPVPLLEGEPVRERVRVRRSSVEIRPKGRFRRRAMYKYELANWYGVSRHHFVDFYLTPVMRKLKAKGYTPGCKLLSLAMVNVICDFQGDPTLD